MLSKIKPQKGKDYKNLPKKILECFDDTKYLVSTKYDGNQIFIVKEGSTIRFFTSDWKEFSIQLIAMELRDIPEDFVIVGEFLYNSDGKLGSRGKSAILTTFRTNFSKGWLNGKAEIGSQVVAFDYISLVNDNLQTSIRQDNRLGRLNQILDGKFLTQPVHVELMTGAEAKVYTKELVKHGWEGTMLTQPHEFYHLGKRVNHAIKLKERPTADLMCIDIIEGEGKYEGMIGSLVLRDSASRLVSVGSGLSDSDRCNLPSDYIGKVIEIQYEQILDTYIQPTFVSIRDDKIKGQ
jgi:ATP-dependent DNA ligase